MNGKVVYDAATVIAGTTLGMLLADVPAVFIGTLFAEKIPMKWIQR
jgi:putative Ca2+/H+ antiporter (TMEM165/GDT1 family)